MTSKSKSCDKTKPQLLCSIRYGKINEPSTVGFIESVYLWDTKSLTESESIVSINVDPFWGAK